MRQFDPKVIWCALQGVKPPGHSGDKPGQVGVYEIIRLLVEIVHDDRVDVKGKPLVTAANKISALKELRGYHRQVAVTHEEFMASAGRQDPDLPPVEDLPDPLVVANEALRVVGGPTDA